MPETLTILLGDGLSPMWVNGDLAFTDDTSVTRCFGSPGEILAQSKRLSPCVLVVDQLFVERLNFEEFHNIGDLGLSVRVVVELARNGLDQAEHLIRIGCAGYLVKGTTAAEAIRAIRAVAAGQMWASRKVISSVLLKLLRESRHRLTMRESEIFGLLSNGLSNSQIAKRLSISPQTVRWHLRSLYSKLGTHDRVGAVMFCADREPALPRKAAAREKTRIADGKS